MKPASSEARKTMPSAMSVTVPTRPIGSRADACRARLVDVVGAEIARPHRQDLIAHFGLGRAQMNGRLRDGLLNETLFG
jgi:hypothetical protein